MQFICIVYLALVCLAGTVVAAGDESATATSSFSGTEATHIKGPSIAPATTFKTVRPPLSAERLQQNRMNLAKGRAIRWQRSQEKKAAAKAEREAAKAARGPSRFGPQTAEGRAKSLAALEKARKEGKTRQRTEEGRARSLANLRGQSNRLVVVVGTAANAATPSEHVYLAAAAAPPPSSEQVLVPTP